MSFIHITDKHFELVDNIRKVLTDKEGFEVYLVSDGELTDPNFQNMCIHIYENTFNKTWVVLLDKDNKMFIKAGEQMLELPTEKDLLLFIYTEFSQEIQ